MDPISIAVGTLGLIENLDKIITLYQDRLGNGFRDAASSEVFGELSILLNILAESKILTDELLDPPMSLSIALTRCQKLSAQLNHQLQEEGILSKSVLSNKTQKLKWSWSAKFQESLGRTVTAFKSAVILFRDIGTKLVRFSTETRHC
jgi:hypothetical protein